MGCSAEAELCPGSCQQIQIRDEGGPGATKTYPKKRHGPCVILQALKLAHLKADWLIRVAQPATHKWPGVVQVRIEEARQSPQARRACRHCLERCAPHPPILPSFVSAFSKQRRRATRIREQCPFKTRASYFCVTWCDKSDWLARKTSSTMPRARATSCPASCSLKRRVNYGSEISTFLATALAYAMHLRRLGKLRRRTRTRFHHCMPCCCIFFACIFLHPHSTCSYLSTPHISCHRAGRREKRGTKQRSRSLASVNSSLSIPCQGT